VQPNIIERAKKLSSTGKGDADLLTLLGKLSGDYDEGRQVVDCIYSLQNA